MDVTGEEVLVSGVKLSLAQGTKSSPAVSSWARAASILFFGFVFYGYRDYYEANSLEFQHSL